MGQEPKWVVTTSEALQVLGIRADALEGLERLAEIASRPRRKGYSVSELSRLMAVLKEGITGKK